MSKKLKVAAVSMAFEGGTQSDATRAIAIEQLSQVLESAKGYDLDLLVLPEDVEAAAQGLEHAESIDQSGQLLGMYQAFARDEQCLVGGSVKLTIDGRIYNAVVYIGPDGNVLGHYAKTNLTLGELEEGILPGSGATLVDTPMGKLGTAICFDLNFFELAESYSQLKPDLIIFSSMYHGGLMQPHWAYRCQCYFIGATGVLGSGILDPFGRPIKLTDCYNKMAMATINLDYILVHLDYHQEKFKAIARKYRDEVSVDIPANIGSALITSLSDQRTAMDIAREFELELCKDYLLQAAALNNTRRRA